MLAGLLAPAALVPATAAAHGRGAIDAGAAHSGGHGRDSRAHLHRARHAARDRHRSGASSRQRHELLRSPQLWATVDACQGGHSPTIGIRASMPGDGHRHDALYVRIRPQYTTGRSGPWKDLSHDASSAFKDLGSADATHQSGETFHITRPPTGSVFTLRGLVEFQWRRGEEVLLSAVRSTGGGHHSKVGSTPTGFSAATCTVH